jgi:riboflavin synthase
MFTGIIEGIGLVRKKSGNALEVGLPSALHERLTKGASIALNGVCLTVFAITGQTFTEGTFSADISQETMSRTALGTLRPGVRVNLELAVSAERALDGHIVLGHVDTVGRIKAIHRERVNWSLIVSYPAEFRRYVVEKGSIAVDGISLTTYSLTGTTFRCAVIPTTFNGTILKDRHVGDPVNIEFDILAKYVEGMIRRVD